MRVEARVAPNIDDPLKPRGVSARGFGDVHVIPAVVVHRAGLRIRRAEAAGDADEEGTRAEDALQDLLVPESILDRENHGVAAEHRADRARGGFQVAHFS